MGALAVLARLFYGPGFVTNDPMWSLAWGRQIIHGLTPAVDAPAASTPHPLPNLVAAALTAVFGTGAEQALHVLGFIAVGFVGHAVFRLTRELLGAAAAVVAVALVLSRPTLASFGPLAVGDVPFCALVLYAIAAGARRPRAWAPVLGLLAVAGLIRPEAWFMAGFYWLWLAVRCGRRTALRALPLVLAGPLTWVVVDWAVTGDPLFSLTATRTAATRYGRVTGIDGLLTQGVHVLGYELRPTMLAVAAVGFVVAWRLDRLAALFLVTAGVAVATAIPVAAGTPLNGRYLLVVLALCCVAAAAAITLPLRHRGTPAAAVAGVALLVVLAGVPDLGDRLDGRRDELLALARDHADARRAARAGIPCGPVSVSGLLLRPAVSVWTGIPLGEVADPRRGVPAHGTFLIGTRRAASSFEQWDVGTPRLHAPAGARTVARHGGWRLSAACPAQ